MLYRLDTTVSQVVSQSDWWCRLHYRCCQQGQRKLYYLWRAKASKESTRMMWMCVPSNQEWCVENASCSLLQKHTWTHMDKHTHTLWQILKCIAFAWLTLTSPYTMLNVQDFFPFLLKWIKGWIFSPRIIHLKLMPLCLILKDYLHQPAPTHQCPECS